MFLSRGTCDKFRRLQTSSTISAPGEQIADALPRPTGRLAIVVGLLSLGLLWFILWRHLSGEWSVNEQYSYGWFVPLFAAYLFWLRWEDRPQPKVEILNSKLEDQGRHFLLSTSAVLLLAALLPLRLFEVGNPDWRPLSWLHALIVVTVTLIAFWRAGGRRWVRHFAFPVCFIMIAVPWVTPIEAPVVQGLMRIVAAVSTETLALFGIAAQLEGSVIRISTGVVGVNEACSGVRSLQTSLMIGLLFGELKRLSVSRRATLVLVASGIAFVANCARAFFLVWIAATRNPEAANEWHDFAGYAIVGAVFAGTMALAALLGDGKVEGRKEKVETSTSGDGEMDEARRENERAQTNQREKEKVETSAEPVIATAAVFPSPISPFYFRFSTFALLLSLIWLAAVEVGVEAWYRSHERGLVAGEQWTVRYPEAAPAFREIEIDEQVRSTLRYDEGRQVAWQPQFAGATGSQGGDNQSLTADSRGTAAVLFFFRWEPGSSSILRARSHRPDVCLPNVGWKQSGDHGVREFPVGRDATLPFRHFAFVRAIPGQRAGYAQSFFCMREDRVSPASGAFDLTADSGLSDWGIRDRIRVVRQGVRNPGQQVMQLVLMSPTEMTTEVAEARFRELLPQIVAVGAADSKRLTGNR